MKRVLFLVVATLLVCGAHPLLAQQSDIAVLRAELAQQQVVIAQLLKRIEALEKQPASTVAESLENLEEDIKAQEDSISSLRETVNSKVNLNGYYNFRFFADGSDEPIAFQQHHLGVLMAKQLGKFNFLMELELQNIPHHSEISRGGEEEVVEPVAEEGGDTRYQRRGAGDRRERVDGIQSPPLLERAGWQAVVTTILVAEPLSEPHAVDCSSYLPPRVVPGGTDRRDGARVSGEAGRHVRARRRL